MTLQPILPGATIGVLGSGQLGRMFAIAARRMGYRVHTFSPDSDTPTGQIADEEIIASYDDLDAVKKFARNVDVVTFEFENVSSAAVDAAASLTRVHPGGHVLHTTQHRLREKTFLAHHGFPVTPFQHIKSLTDLKKALEIIGCPAVLKTAGFGYDGKGQSKITKSEQAAEAYLNLGHREAILEAFVNFKREVSVVAARSVDGQFVHYGVVSNEHHNHILDLTLAPAPISRKLQKEAIEITHGVLESLKVVGVMCVEFFITKDGKLLVNETAPRPHNSGHFTFDASVTSQFEQQLRAVCGLPLGSTELMRPAAMVNLLGDIWQFGEPNWAAAAAFPNVKIHLYGKLEPRKGRKMGHLTALAKTPDEARLQAIFAREALLTR